MSNQTETPPTTANPAVARCHDAWIRAYRAELETSRSISSASYSAARAYRDEMPPLIGYDDIRAFIACVAQGILLDAFDSTQSSKLLYAAQVALTTVRNQPAPPKASAA